MYSVVLYKVVAGNVDLFYLVCVETYFDSRLFGLLVSESLTEAMQKAMEKYDEYASMKLPVSIEIREIQADHELPSEDQLCS